MNHRSTIVFHDEWLEPCGGVEFEEWRVKGA
jgi:hypothetical protein